MFKFAPLTEVFAQINPEHPLAFDTETVGWYGRIKLAQFYQRGWEYVLVTQNPNPEQLYVELAKRNDMNIVMQNASYDVSTIQRNSGARFIPKTFSDTFLLSRLAYPHLEKFKLDSLFQEILGINPYSEHGLVKSDMQKSDWKATQLTREQVLYAAIDVKHLLDLYDKVKHCEETLSYKLDMLALRKALDFQCNGFPVDRNRVEEQRKKNEARIAEIALPINANSYKQVRPYIDSGLSDDQGLAFLSLKAPTEIQRNKAKAVRETRGLLKEISFMKNWDTHDGHIYGVFSPSARSGRFTCREDNLQQLPRKLKHCFGYETNGEFVFGYSDYSQLELRGIGAITNEQVIYNLYSRGEDLHNYTAKSLFGPNYTKEHRQISKQCNFNLLYGGQATMLQSIILKEADIWVEEEDCRRTRRKWLRTFPALAQWQENGVRAHNRGSLGYTPLGRPYKSHLMTDHLNIQNQGFGAEVAKLAMHYMGNDLKPFDAEIINFMHDAYAWRAPNDPEAYQGAAKVVGNSMKEAWIECVQNVKCKDMPMPVEVNVGFNWGDIENDKEGAIIYSYKV